MSIDSAVFQPGIVFGRDFKILRALKSGGMGSVFVVEQLSTGKQRALKVMNPDLAQDATTRERFVLEARAASQIDSDHVVEIVTAGVDDDTGAPYLVMELLRGEELEDAFARIGPLPVGDVAEVLSQVGHALERAHAMGIVHRDLKPQNIFLAASRRKDAPFTAKILDFGIAKLVADNQKTSTQALGSPLYMAPEQTDSKARILPATDVWALGLITYRLLTGEEFWRELTSLPALLREVVVEPIPFASERAKELGAAGKLPVGFDAWFARCVNRDVHLRFPEAGACVRAFSELIEPGAPSGKLTINVQMDQTRPTFNAGLPASALIGSGPRQPLGTAPAPAQIVTGPPLTAEEAAALASSKTTNITGQAVVAQGVPASSAKRPFPRALLIGIPFVLGAAVAIAVVLRGAPGTSGAAPSTSAPAASAPAPSASASASASAAASGTCPEGMSQIPGGPMFMGARDLIPDADAMPPHRVQISTFCLDRTEVTTAAYQACVSKGHCERALDHVSWPNITDALKTKYSDFCNADKDGRGAHPINCVAWAMADNYCKQMGARLPTEAEWEYAARGSSQRKYPWGDDAPAARFLNACDRQCAEWKRSKKDSDKTMFDEDDGFLGTAPVGSFPAGASAHGALDLAGNVWEWTSDWYRPYSDTDSTKPPVDPKGPSTGEKRVLRGGDYLGSEPDWARPSYRWKTIPETYNHAIGFRCAKTP